MNGIYWVWDLTVNKTSSLSLGGQDYCETGVGEACWAITMHCDMC